MRKLLLGGLALLVLLVAALGVYVALQDRSPIAPAEESATNGQSHERFPNVATWRKGDGTWHDWTPVEKLAQVLDAEDVDEVVVYREGYVPQSVKAYLIEENWIPPNLEPLAELWVTVHVGQSVLAEDEVVTVEALEPLPVPKGLDAILPDVSAVREVVPGESGVAVVRVLPGVPYSVAPRGWGYSPESRTVQAEAGNIQAVPFFMLLDNPQWGGRVAGLAGEPLDEAVVTLKETSVRGGASITRDIAQTTTAVNGAFVLVGGLLQAPLDVDSQGGVSDLSLWVRSPAGIVRLLDVPRADTGKVVDVGLIETDAPRSLAIVASRDGEPVVGATASLWIDDRLNLEAVTDSMGRCSFVGLPRGPRYWLSVTTSRGDRFASNVSLQVEFAVDPIQVVFAAIEPDDLTQRVNVFLDIDLEKYGVSPQDRIGLHAVRLEDRREGLVDSGRIGPDRPVALHARSQYIAYIWIPRLELISNITLLDTSAGTDIRLRELSLVKWSVLNIVAPSEYSGHLFVSVWVANGGPKLRGSIWYKRFGVEDSYEFALPPNVDLEVRYYFEHSSRDRRWGPSVTIPGLQSGERQEVQLTPVE